LYSGRVPDLKKKFFIRKKMKKWKKVINKKAELSPVYQGILNFLGLNLLTTFQK